jgi:hypothetical protein
MLHQQNELRGRWGGVERGGAEQSSGEHGRANESGDGFGSGHATQGTIVAATLETAIFKSMTTVAHEALLGAGNPKPVTKAKHWLKQHTPHRWRRSLLGPQPSM